MLISSGSPGAGLEPVQSFSYQLTIYGSQLCIVLFYRCNTCFGGIRIPKEKSIKNIYSYQKPSITLITWLLDFKSESDCVIRSP